MRVELAFWAEKITGRPDGRLDLEGFGPFVLATSHLPMAFPPYDLPVLLRFTSQDKDRRCTLRYTVFAPNNTPIFDDQTTVRSPYPQIHDIITVRLENFPIATDGTYRIAFEAGGVKFDVFFDVLVRPELAAESNEPPR
ncbi:MAG: hypothetical protein ACR2JW_08130 [Thermomicrobiales bacterium]